MLTMYQTALSQLNYAKKDLARHQADLQDLKADNAARSGGKLAITMQIALVRKAAARVADLQAKVDSYPAHLAATFRAAA